MWNFPFYDVKHSDIFLVANQSTKYINVSVDIIKILGLSNEETKGPSL